MITILTLLWLRGAGASERDAAIHRGLKNANGVACWVIDYPWIATGFQPSAMTRIEAATGATNLPRGLRGPGMALLGCRPFGPGPPRSALLSASAVILPSLAHCFWKPTRKPRVLKRMLGGS